MQEQLTQERVFPIQSERGAKPHPLKIPWSIAELAYSVYSGRYGRGQSLEELAERGGFGPGEMDMFVPDWREQCSYIATLLSDRAALQRRCGEMEKAEAENKVLKRQLAHASESEEFWKRQVDHLNSLPCKNCGQPIHPSLAPAASSNKPSDCPKCQKMREQAQAEWDAGGSPQSLPVRCPHGSGSLPSTEGGGR